MPGRAREEPDGTLCLKWPGYTQPHGDKGHLIRNFRLHRSDSVYYRLVCALVNLHAYYIGRVVSAPGAFQVILSRLPILRSPSSIHTCITVSGPVCILLCIPVMSAEVYKKLVAKLILGTDGRAKVEIKRYCSFSLGWPSSKDSEMHYKYK